MIIQADNSLSADLLTGSKAIADYLGWPVRRVHHFKSRLPIRQFGRVLFARKSELDRALSANGNSEERP